MAFKFYKPSEYNEIYNISISDVLDEKVIFVENIDSLINNQKITIDEFDKFYNIVKKYECVVIYHYEHIYINGFMSVMNQMYKDGKIVIFNTFTSGIKNYFDKKFPNNKFYVKSIIDNIKGHLEPFVNLENSSTESSFKINTKDKRQYLLKAFSFNRSPHRDYVMDVLMKKKLVDGNNVSFHNHPFDVKNETITYSKLIQCNNAYNTSEAFDMYKSLNYELLNSICIIPESQKFDIHNQPKHTEQNSLASINSYFEILSEAQMPLSTDLENSQYYTYCVTKRTITPLFYGNVFHIMPFSKLMIEDFNKNDICTFFDSDEDFFNNLNEDFFFKKETTEKLIHNHNIVKNYYKEYVKNQSNHKNFVISKLESIFSVELFTFK